MANMKKLKVNGVTYDIKDANAIPQTGTVQAVNVTSSGAVNFNTSSFTINGQPITANGSELVYTEDVTSEQWIYDSDTATFTYTIGYSGEIAAEGVYVVYPMVGGEDWTAENDIDNIKRFAHAHIMATIEAASSGLHRLVLRTYARPADSIEIAVLCIKCPNWYQSFVVGSSYERSFGFEIKASEWVQLTDADPYDYYAAISTTGIGDNDTISLINNSAVLFAQHCFAIGSFDSATGTLQIYSVGAPSEEVTLTCKVR